MPFSQLIQPSRNRNHQVCKECNFSSFINFFERDGREFGSFRLPNRMHSIICPRHNDKELNKQVPILSPFRKLPKVPLDSLGVQLLQLLYVRL